MSGNSLVTGSFVVADYVVFVLMLVVSAAVGVYFAWMDKSQSTSRDFLTGGRRMTALPVSMSLTASFMSSITVLSNPAEVYCYGAIFIFFGLAYTLTMVVTSEVFLPVFCRLAITSTYEILYTGIIIYGPALALSQVTDVDLWGGIISTGLVCTFYCTLIGIMLIGYLSVIIKSAVLQGGVLTIISDSQQGGRLNFLDFDMNPLRRHTFWTIVIGGTSVWISVYGINQAQVQRYISCKNITHARVSVYISLLGLCSFLVSSVFAGMSLYSVYKNCDPWTAGLISTPDQLMPYLVMDVLTGYPGLPGLFFAAVYSGSLSTVSSSINAMAAVTLEDLIKPYTNMSERQLFRLSKGLSFLYGILCICMAGLASVMGKMMEASASISGIIGGPLLGLFILGILFPFANSKGGLSGLVSGLVVSISLGIGAVISPSPPSMTRPLPLTTKGCNFTATDSLNWTSTALPTESSSITTSPPQTSDGYPLLGDNWYTPSYLYFSLIGTVTTISVGLIVSLLTGGWKTKVESRFTLMKEDTTVYYLFKFFKDRVMRQTGKLDLTKERENIGNTNLAFCDTELDLTKNNNPI
ncbi:hypothetical protein PAMP_014896 [Pampus punctatissimus]